MPQQSRAPAHAAHRRIVNTTAGPSCDDYVAWAAQLFNAPIALTSLVDNEYVHFKAVTGAILLDAPVITGDYTWLTAAASSAPTWPRRSGPTSTPARPC